MGQVTLTSTIPDSHPKKAAIEDLVREDLGALPGVWTATIQARETGRWFATLERAQDGYKRTLILAPQEQTPALVALALQGALGDALELAR